VSAELDTRRFRDAMRRFATGVTIITTNTPEGAPVGLTANSFNSVSLSPPLVLWSLNRHSRSLRVFQGAAHYAVSVLCADQMALATRFAAPVEDRFAGVPWHGGRAGMPLFEGCVAWFECRSAFQYDGGDHVIFVGEVTDFGYSDRIPLLYAGGAYGIPAPHPDLARMPAA
jgi:flavin reductase (DIM6/NTAB) family NADH-FMN oxidoreductase RutF